MNRSFLNNLAGQTEKYFGWLANNKVQLENADAAAMRQRNLSAQMRADALAESTNPANVKALADAEVLKQGIVKKGQLGVEASSIDTPEYKKIQEAGIAEKVQENSATNFAYVDAQGNPVSMLNFNQMTPEQKATVKPATIEQREYDKSKQKEEWDHQEKMNNTSYNRQLKLQTIVGYDSSTMSPVTQAQLDAGIYKSGNLISKEGLANEEQRIKDSIEFKSYETQNTQALQASNPDLTKEQLDAAKKVIAVNYYRKKSGTDMAITPALALSLHDSASKSADKALENIEEGTKAAQKLEYKYGVSTLSEVRNRMVQGGVASGMDTIQALSTKGTLDPQSSIDILKGVDIAKKTPMPEFVKRYKEGAPGLYRAGIEWYRRHPIQEGTTITPEEKASAISRSSYTPLPPTEEAKGSDSFLKGAGKTIRKYENGLTIEQGKELRENLSRDTKEKLDSLVKSGAISIVDAYMGIKKIKKPFNEAAKEFMLGYSPK